MTRHVNAVFILITSLYYRLLRYKDEKKHYCHTHTVSS